MKITKCDVCFSENARSYKYQIDRRWSHTDLCVNCLQDFVLKNQVKLVEVHDSGAGAAGKRVIHG